MSPDPSSVAGGTLEVDLLSARGLRHTDWFKKSDPYAVITCGSKTQRSNTARRQGTNPTWNQNFKFYIEEGVKELTMKLYDADRLKRDDFLGNVSIPLSGTFARGSTPATAYNVVLASGKFKGEVKVELKFTPKPIPRNNMNIPGPYERNASKGWQMGYLGVME